MQKPSVSSEYEARLITLEKSAARQKRAAIVLALVILGGGLLWGQEPRGRIRDLFRPEVQTEVPDQHMSPLVVQDSITVVDADGKERAMLTATPDGASLVLFDSQGRPRVGVTAGYTTSVTLYDDNQQTRAILGTTSMVPSHVQSSDGTIERSPESSLVLFKQDGTILERLP